MPRRSRRSRGRRGATPPTVVMPSATSPAITSAAPARMSLASTGAPESRLDPVDHDVVAVHAGVRAEPGQLLDGTEARLEEVLGDHRRALGHGVEGQRERLQVGREARVGQRRHVERRRPRGRRHPEPAARLDVAPACTSLSSATDRWSALAAATSCRRGSWPRRTPRCRPRSGRARPRARWASASTPSTSIIEVPTPLIRAPIETASRRCRRSPAHARRCDTGCPGPAPRR